MVGGDVVSESPSRIPGMRGRSAKRSNSVAAAAWPGVAAVAMRHINPQIHKGQTLRNPDVCNAFSEENVPLVLLPGGLDLSMRPLSVKKISKIFYPRR